LTWAYVLTEENHDYLGRDGRNLNPGSFEFEAENRSAGGEILEV
jgi:hypothetical protein